MTNRIRTGDHVVSVKDIARSTVKFPRLRQTPEEGRRTYRLKRNGNKDEDNTSKNLNDKKKDS